MVVHLSATSATMEVDPPRNANSPDDPKTANGSSENEKAEDSESSEDGPLDVGEHYLVRRFDDTWREYMLNNLNPFFIRSFVFARRARACGSRPVPAGAAQRDFGACVR